MLEITHGDIRAAARVLMDRPERQWPALTLAMLAEADCAARHLRIHGRVHPRLGNGSLMSTALAHGPRAAPLASDLGYLRAMAAVIEAVLARRADHSS